METVDRTSFREVFDRAINRNDELGSLPPNIRYSWAPTGALCSGVINALFLRSSLTVELGVGQATRESP
jgi:hypothetical protein